LEGEELAQAKRDATILVLKLQEDAGLDIVTDGEQSRKHFVHGFLEFVEGIDFEHQVAMGIRNNRYTAMVPTVRAAVRLKGRVHQTEARIARAHTRRQLKMTLPGPMTICDTIADQDHHYRDRAAMAFAFADLLNQEARALEADGVDVIQFDEPAFNVFMSDVTKWGIAALERALADLKCTTVVHICYGYGIKANLEWKASLGGRWTQYQEIFPALSESSVMQVSVEARNSRVPMELLGLLKGKDVLLGVIDVASEAVESAEDVVAVIEQAMKFVPPERILPSTNCGMAPMARDVALAKLEALGAGAALARKRFGQSGATSGEWTCSGRTPRPRTRAGRRCRIGQRCSQWTTAGIFGSSPLVRMGSMTLFWMSTWSACVARVGSIRRDWTRRRSASEGRPASSGRARTFAAATAS
jgi:5-methyltetrahydropteroyltriglutamate--homocysteine methyltransferase